MNRRSGSILLWVAFAVLLACLLLIVYAIRTTVVPQSAGKEQYVPQVFVERAPVCTVDPDSVVESKKPQRKTQEEREEEERIREVTEAGVM